MLSVNGCKPARESRVKPSGSLREIATILQNCPPAVSRILAQLQRRSPPATSPARQVAQTAIASRCGDGAGDGIFFLEALSLPVSPVKLYGRTAASAGRPPTGAPSPMLLQGYEGFKSPLFPLNKLPEQHSFVDLFEHLLLCSRESGEERSILASEGVELGTTIIAGLTAKVTIEHGGFTEIVKYAVAEEIAGMHKDIAQFTGRTIAQLGAITERLW